jgi:hypothetical protein
MTVVKWNDEKSSLISGTKTYRKGDIVPAGVLSKERIEYLQSKKSVIILESEEPKKESKTESKSKKKTTFFDDEKQQGELEE